MTELIYKFRSEREVKNLNLFVMNQIELYGGKELLSNVESVNFDENFVKIKIKEKNKKYQIHSALFFTQNCGTIKCCFESE